MCSVLDRWVEGVLVGGDRQITVSKLRGCSTNTRPAQGQHYKETQVGHYLVMDTRIQLRARKMVPTRVRHGMWHSDKVACCQWKKTHCVMVTQYVTICILYKTLSTSVRPGIATKT